jgi:DNA-binding MarR family transcriptional regulator
LSENFLSESQASILIVLSKSLEHSLFVEEILGETEIAISTFSTQIGRLAIYGLVNKNRIRVMSENGIATRMNYSLTEKGKVVALHLAHISRLVKEEQFSIPHLICD